MATDYEKASGFVARLLQNPTMDGLSSLQREEQIIQFLNVNGSKLYPTLSSDAFFQDRNWSTIYQILLQALQDLTNKDLVPGINGIINSKINFSFISFLEDVAAGESEHGALRQQLADLVEKMIHKQESRRSLTGTYTALKTKILDRYIERVFDRQKYISFELRKVQRLRMGQEETANMIKVSMLLRSAVSFFSAIAGSNDLSQTLIVKPQFTEKVTVQLEKLLKSFPLEAIVSGPNSNLSFSDNPKIEATARLSAIFSLRCVNYNPKLLKDKGSESSDMSWFNIARRNYRYYGFDLDMLSELYNIAAENGW